MFSSLRFLYKMLHTEQQLWAINSALRVATSTLWVAYSAIVQNSRPMISTKCWICSLILSILGVQQHFFFFQVQMFLRHYCPMAQVIESQWVSAWVWKKSLFFYLGEAYIDNHIMYILVCIIANIIACTTMHSIFYENLGQIIQKRKRFAIKLS